MFNVTGVPRYHMNVQMRYSLTSYLSFIYTDIESLSSLAPEQMVLDNFQDFLELSKFIDCQIAQSTHVSKWYEQCVTNIDRVLIIHREERPGASPYRSVILVS